MDNSDFRKLLETPRAERWGSQTPSNKPQATSKPDKPKGEHRPHRPHGRPGFKKPTDKGKEDAEDDDAPKYRDRAEERRRGKNLDYEDASAVLSALAGSGGGGEGLGPGGDLGGAVDLSKLSEEETKYLGGDMRFTHLVKGLDFALLHKTRSEITKKKDGDEDEGEEGEGEEGGGGAKAGAVGREASRDAQARAAARANAATAAGRKEELRFTTPLARSVFGTLFTAPRSNVREMYLPRRTAFVYDFENEDSLDTDIPTTLRRPKSECPPAVDTLFAGMDNAVLDRIARILSYVRTTADGKRLKRRDRDALLGIRSEAAADGQAAAAAGGAAGPGTGRGDAAAAAAGGPGRPKGPVDDDDDIFGDAGTDYKPTNNKASKAKDQGAVRRPDGSYFDSKDTMADIPMPGTSIRRPGAAAAAGTEGGGGGGDDMDLEEGEMAPPPPPPVGPAVTAGGMGYGAQADGPQYGAAPYGGQGYDQYNAYGGQQGYGMDAYGGAQGAYAAAAYRAAQQPAANAYGSTEEPKWRSRPKDTQARGLDAEADDDAYAECYPGMAGYVGALVDSDDEGAADLNHMDSKQAKGKTRADFATDEEWQRHKESRETLPRAAFQYGVKRADGRKSHKELEKGAATELRQRDQKLDGQLRKIERLLQEKGHEHAGAFARKPKDAGGEAGGAGGGGGRGDETPSVHRKRQRI